MYHCSLLWFNKTSSEAPLLGHVSPGLCKVLSRLSLDPPPQHLPSVEFCSPLGLPHQTSQLTEGGPAGGSQAGQGPLESTHQRAPQKGLQSQRTPGRLPQGCGR